MKEDQIFLHFPLGLRSGASGPPGPLHTAASGLALIGVLDGHAGPRCGHHVKEILPRVLSGILSAHEASGPPGPHPGGHAHVEPQPGHQGYAAALKEAFRRTDAEILALPDAIRRQGATATLVLAWREAASGDILLQASNVGDSEAYFFMLEPGPSAGSNTGSGGVAATVLAPPPSGPGGAVNSNDPSSTQAPPGATPGPAASLAPIRAVCLTEPHRLTNPSERARMVAAGFENVEGERRVPLKQGTVPATSRDGTHFLALTRALGDQHFKEGYEGAVSSEPFVSTPVRIPKGSQGLLIVATDGVWDFLKESAVIARAEAEVARGRGVTGAVAALLKKLEPIASDDYSLVVMRVAA